MADIIDFPTMAENIVCPECGSPTSCDCADRDLKSREDEHLILNYHRFQKPFAEFNRFINLEMSEEEGMDYMSKIGFTLILGSNQTPLGLIGTAEWGWFDTMSCTASFPIREDIIRTVAIPPIENWGFDTTDLIADLNDYCLHGTSTSRWNVSDEPKAGGIVH